MRKEKNGIYEEANSTRWYRKNELHREDGPAIEFTNGDKCWALNGDFHRVDGPAMEHVNGSKEWWINGNKHRVDGPAYEGMDGSKEWWIEGQQFTEQNFNQWLAQKALNDKLQSTLSDRPKNRKTKI